MSSLESILEPGLEDVRDGIDDFVRGSYQAAGANIARIVAAFDEEPLSGFLANALPVVDFAAWYEKTKATRSGMAGSGFVELPARRPERVAIQIALCRELAEGNIRFLDFVHDYYYSGTYLPDHVDAFTEKFLEPLLRDIIRMTEHRSVAPVLLSALGTLPSTGDAVLDELLNQAIRYFQDPAPEARARAVEKLWDSWERFKSLKNPENKRLSVQALLDEATTEPSVRELLDEEARKLTDIGNRFHIRHFEADRNQVPPAEVLDYLFHRLFSLIQLLVFSSDRA